MLRRVPWAAISLIGFTTSAWLLNSGCQANDAGNFTPTPPSTVVAQGGASTSEGSGGASETTRTRATTTSGPKGGSASASNPKAQGGSSSKSAAEGEGGEDASGGSTKGGTTAKASTTKGGSTSKSSTTAAAKGGTKAASTTEEEPTEPARATATKDNCATDLMTLLTGASSNWLGYGDETCGMQGSVYGYGDGSTCEIPDAGICADGKCCISGETAGGLDGAEDYSNYGCGIGFDLNATAGSSSTKMAYTAEEGPAKGFKIGISGKVATGQKIRIKWAQAAKLPASGTAPYEEVTTVTAAGGDHYWADATCPDWTTSSTCSLPKSGPFALQIELVGGGAEKAVGPFTDFCITSLVPIF